jgi:hypothetical protein
MIFRVASGKVRKSSRVFGWLAVGSVLSLLLAVVLATAAQAANEPQVLLDPTEGKLDDRVHVEGTGLEAAAYFYLYFSSDSASVGSVLEESITHYKLLERNLKTTDETALRHKLFFEADIAADGVFQHPAPGDVARSTLGAVGGRSQVYRPTLGAIEKPVKEILVEDTITD